MSPRRACSKDANQDEIADVFRRLGWDVIDTHQFAQFLPGWPDLVVIRGRLLTPASSGLLVWGSVVLGIEIKAPGGRLTVDELAFAMAHPEWAPIVVRTVDDVVRLTREI